MCVYVRGLKWRRFAYRIEKRAEVYEKALDTVQDGVLQAKIQWCIENVREASSMEVSSSSPVSFCVHWFFYFLPIS